MASIVATELGTPAGRAVHAVRINRSSRRNSLSPIELEALLGIWDTARGRVVVLTAEPPAYCAGLDLKYLAGEADVTGAIRRCVEGLAELYRRIIAHHGPTLTIVDGAAVGGGLGLAACFDRVLATRRSTFVLPGGALEPLAQLVVPTLKRRKIPVPGAMSLSAREARALGVADDVWLQAPGESELLVHIDAWLESQGNSRQIVSGRAKLDEPALQARIDRATDSATLARLEVTLRQQYG